MQLRAFIGMMATIAALMTRPALPQVRTATLTVKFWHRQSGCRKTHMATFSGAQIHVGRLLRLVLDGRGWHNVPVDPAATEVTVIVDKKRAAQTGISHANIWNAAITEFSREFPDVRIEASVINFPL